MQVFTSLQIGAIYMRLGDATEYIATLIDAQNLHTERRMALLYFSTQRSQIKIVRYRPYEYQDMYICQNTSAQRIFPLVN